jgi:dTMP kinase
MLNQGAPRTPLGFFISLDGPDGAGKTTQVARLVEWLGGLGCDVVACRDPGGSPLGDRIRAILLERGQTPIGMRAEMLLYMASRAQLVETVIRPALAKGCVVVSDRYLLANVIYQGYAGGLPVDEIWRIGQTATDGLMPDLTLLIDVPPATAHARVGPPRDRMEDRSDDYRDRVRRGFFEAGKVYTAPIVLVDGSGDADTVAHRIRTEVARALAFGSRT